MVQGAKAGGLLTADEFLEVVDRAPLVSIDLVLRSSAGKVLMGMRTGQPARGYWFVPGGRIRKGETIGGAFARVCIDELGVPTEFAQARFLGAYSHIYDTNFADEPGIGTEYVVLGYEVQVPPESEPDLDALPTTQHSTYDWFGRQDDLSNVHPNARLYLDTPCTLDRAQYPLLNSRRDSFNNLLWQTPVLSLIAQAFLFTIILNSASSTAAVVIASLLSMLTAAATRHLLDKHRDSEERCAKLLDHYEGTTNCFALNGKSRAETRWLSFSAYQIWKWTLPLFGVAALAGLILRLLDV